METLSGSVQSRSIDTATRKIRPFIPSTIQRKHHRLSDSQLKLAIGTAIVDGMTEDEVIDRLWREHPIKVKHFYQTIKLNRGYSGYMEPFERKRSYAAPTKVLTRNKVGLTLSELALKLKLKAATVVALLEHHGLLELVPYGLEQSRRLVTENAYTAHLGHNILPSRIARLEGHSKSSVFPVFYEDRLQDLLWLFDLDGIYERMGKEDGKKGKLRWLLMRHSYLPDDEIATLSGYTRRGVIKARRRSNLGTTEVEASRKFTPQINPIITCE